jgi:hypothetical protein
MQKSRTKPSEEWMSKVFRNCWQLDTQIKERLFSDLATASVKVPRSVKAKVLEHKPVVAHDNLKLDSAFSMASATEDLLLEGVKLPKAIVDRTIALLKVEKEYCQAASVALAAERKEEAISLYVSAEWYGAGATVAKESGMEELAKELFQKQVAKFEHEGSLGCAIDWAIRGGMPRKAINLLLKCKDFVKAANVAEEAGMVPTAMRLLLRGKRPHAVISVAQRAKLSRSPIRLSKSDLRQFQRTLSEDEKSNDTYWVPKMKEFIRTGRATPLST